MKHQAILCSLFSILVLPYLALGQAGPSIGNGIAQFETGDLTNATAFFQKMLEAHPSHAESAFYLGRIAFDKNDLPTARTWFEKAAEWNADDADYQFWLAESIFAGINEVGALKKMRYAKKGKRALERCISLDPQYASCYDSLVVFYYQAPKIAGGSIDKALAYAHTLRDLDAKAGGILLATVYADQKKFEQAAQEIDLVISAYPEDVDVYYRAGMFYQEQKTYEKAFSHFEQAVQIDPQAAAASLYQVGRTAVFSGQRVQRGIAALQDYQSLELDRTLPSKAAALWRLGMLHEISDAPQEARDAYEAALKLEPDNKEVKKALSKLDSP